MESIPRNYSDILNGQLSPEKYSSDQTPPSPNNGSIIALIVATIPIIILILILVSFKICEKVCPPGQRRELSSRSRRRISTMSSFSTTLSRNNSTSQLGSHCVGSAGSSGHLNIHHAHPPIVHHQVVTTRADGTPLLVAELETIRDQDEEEEEDLGIEMKV